MDNTNVNNQSIEILISLYYLENISLKAIVLVNQIGFIKLFSSEKQYHEINLSQNPHLNDDALNNLHPNKLLSIKTLYLSGSGIGTKGLISLFKKTNLRLEYLDLSYLDIDIEYLQFLGNDPLRQMQINFNSV